MEVHHHSHTARKKWTHYFLEFLMLFLAVFCGFLAEYQLEHKIEKSREKQFIKSFVEDLEADTTTFNQRLAYCQLTIRRVDSLAKVLNSPDLNAQAGEVYYFLRWMHRSEGLSVNDRTIVQLRNSGGMRLIKNKSVSDSMVGYYKDIDFIGFIYDEQLEFRRSLRPYFPKILDGNDYTKVIDNRNVVVRPAETVRLRSTDPETINALLLLLNNIQGINFGLHSRIEALKLRAINMRSFIKEEYNL